MQSKEEEMLNQQVERLLEGLASEVIVVG